MEQKKEVKNARIVNARRGYERNIKELEKRLEELQKKCKHPNTREGFDDQRYRSCDDCGKIW